MSHEVVTEEDIVTEEVQDMSVEENESVSEDWNESESEDKEFVEEVGSVFAFLLIVRNNLLYNSRLPLTTPKQWMQKNLLMQ